jgi:hypothetical protein
MKYTIHESTIYNETGDWAGYIDKKGRYNVSIHEQDLIEHILSEGINVQTILV